MAASETRAGIEYAHDYYLMPLPATIITKDVLDSYLNTLGSYNIEPIYRFPDNAEAEKIAQGFEIIETVTGQADREIISFPERRLVIRSINHAKAQEQSLNKRLNQAKTAITDLTRPLEFLQVPNNFGLILACS